MSLGYIYSFLEKFEKLNLVLLSETECMLVSKQGIKWAIGTYSSDKASFTTLTKKSFVLDAASEEENNEFLEEINHLAQEFEELVKEETKRIRTEKTNRSKSFAKELISNAKLKQSAQGLIQILGELSRPYEEIADALAAFELWRAFYDKIRFKISFFRKNEFVSHLNNMHRFLGKTPDNYHLLSEKVIKWSDEHQIDEKQILFYAVLRNIFLNNNPAEKLIFTTFFAIEHQKKDSKKLWTNDSDVLQLSDTLDFGKGQVNGAFFSFEELLLSYLSEHTASDFALQAHQEIAQTGIFGSSASVLLTKKVQEQKYDSIFLSLDSYTPFQNKRFSLFESLPQTDRQRLLTIWENLGKLSPNGNLFVLLPNSDWVKLPYYQSVRRVLEEWAQTIHIWETRDNQSTVLMLSNKKSGSPVALQTLAKNCSIRDFEVNHPNTNLQDWQAKKAPSAYQKLLPIVGKGGLFKQHFVWQKEESDKMKKWVSENKSNLTNKVKKSLQKQNDKLQRKYLATQSKTTTTPLFSEQSEQKVSYPPEPIDFETKNLFEGKISPFEEQFWYYEKSVWQNGYPLMELFPKIKSKQAQKNILLCWMNTQEGGLTWIADEPLPPSFFADWSERVFVVPIYFYKDGQKEVNLNTKWIEKLKSAFVRKYERREEKIKESLNRLFDVSDFEFLQIAQELAIELQAWTAWLETKVAQSWKENALQPRIDTQNQHEQGRKIFSDTKRQIKRLSSKSIKDKDSRTTLLSYFENDVFELVSDYWQQLEEEQMSGFVVPTAQNMTNERIVEYVVGVWNYEPFKKKYQSDLQNESPRAALYKDFHQMADQGAAYISEFVGKGVSEVEVEAIEIINEELPKMKNKKKWFVRNIEGDENLKPAIWADEQTYLVGIPDDFFIKTINGKLLSEMILEHLRSSKSSLENGKELIQEMASKLCH